jgi:hypothetical protein
MEFSENCRKSLAPRGACSQRSHKIDGGAGTDDSLVILGSCLSTLRSAVGSWHEFWEIDGLQQFEFTKKNAEMRSVELIG